MSEFLIPTCFPEHKFVARPLATDVDRACFTAEYLSRPAIIEGFVRNWPLHHPNDLRKFYELAGFPIGVVTVDHWKVIVRAYTTLMSGDSRAACNAREARRAYQIRQTNDHG
jgi:hypothetical protein